MAGSRTAGEPPEPFQVALASLRRGCTRPEVVLSETAAPQRLAPYSVALSADVVVDDVELSTGRLVLLYDPAGHDTWRGVFRLVTYVRAELDAEMVADPMLAAVGWAWLLDALRDRGARHVEASGTITRAASESFGSLSTRPASAEVEIRASWTPLDADLSRHVGAWCELLCTTAGLPPAATPKPGPTSPAVTVLPARSRH